MKRAFKIIILTSALAGKAKGKKAGFNSKKLLQVIQIST